jgi:signal transduction histidine kinase/CheY-like chemotaxis protein
MLTDISERKRSQETLESSNRELEARVASRTLELESRNRQLEKEIASRIASDEQRRALETRLRESERFESLGLLAAGIAHDFNNLLVSVLGNADLLLLTPELSESSRESLKLIKQAGHNASALTHHLLMFAGEGAVRLAAVDLPSAAVSALALLQPNLPSRIRLETQLARACPAIHADASQINQIVMNLVTNAAEAIDGQGQISVSTHAAELDAAALAEFQHHRCAQPGQFVILQVQDSGSGMDAATVSRIFDPFFSTKFTGRGLGLASVLGIAQGHCGALRVRTREGAGTSFEIAFPVSSHEPVRLAKPSVPVLDWSGSGPLLLIDDDDAVRRVLTLLLRALGFDVTAVASGKAGLELFMRKDPAFPVVVLDWLMPGLSGEQVLRALRELEPTLPVLLVSGYSAQDFESNDAYVARLQKPMTLGQLRAALRRLTGSALAARSSAARER